MVWITALLDMYCTKREIQSFVKKKKKFFPETHGHRLVVTIGLGVVEEEGGRQGNGGQI